MNKLSSDELLGLIELDHQNEFAKKCFQEFYSRFQEYVWKICAINAKRVDMHNYIQTASTLLNNTFFDVYRNASKFRVQSDNTDLDVKRWLGGIVNNKMLQYLDEKNKFHSNDVFLEIILNTEDEPITHEIESHHYPLHNIEKRLLTQALNQLSEKQRSILLTWLTFQINEGDRIPKEIKEKLAKEHKVKVSSLKMIKKRAFDKVKTFIDRKQQEHEQAHSQVK